jgi:hypothetical protein
VLQSISKDGYIINHSELGKKVAKFSQDNVSIVYEQIDAGFMDGGCLVLAKAFKDLFEKIIPEVQTTIVSIGRFSNDHALLEVPHPDYGFVYIDADGVCTLKNAQAKMIQVEHLTHANRYEFNFDQDEVFTYEEIGLPDQILEKLINSDLPAEIISTFAKQNNLFNPESEEETNSWSPKC